MLLISYEAAHQVAPLAFSSWLPPNGVTPHYESEAAMEVRFYLTGEDVWNFTKYSLFRARTFLPLGLIFGILILLGLLFGPNDPTSAVFSVFPFLIALLIVVLLLAILLRRSAHGKTAQYLALQGEQTITLRPDGFHLRNNFMDALIFWRAVKSITADQHNLYFLVQSNRIVAHVIPRRAFASPQAAEAFLSQAQSWWATGQRLPPSPPAETRTSWERFS